MTLEHVKTFKYVRGIIKSDRKYTEEVKMKTNRELQTIGRMRTLWKNNTKHKYKIKVVKYISNTSNLT